jgi:hypothetical protein
MTLAYDHGNSLIFKILDVDETRAYQSRGAPHQCWTSILGCNQNMSNLFKILNACSVLWLTMNTNPKLDLVQILYKLP